MSAQELKAGMGRATVRGNCTGVRSAAHVISRHIGDVLESLGSVEIPGAQSPRVVSGRLGLAVPTVETFSATPGE